MRNLPNCPKCGVMLKDKRSQACRLHCDRSWMKGRKLSEEHKRKISESEKGRIFSPEARAKLRENNSRYWLGKTRPSSAVESQRAKMKGKMPKNLSLINANKNGSGNPMFGKIVSEETRKKLSEANRMNWATNETRKEKARLQFSGENNPRWVGGMDYWSKDETERRTIASEGWAKKVKKRDNFKCQLANENCYGYMVAHHILPWRDYPEERYNIKNGITLCQYHHPVKWSKEKEMVPILQALVNQEK